MTPSALQSPRVVEGHVRPSPPPVCSPCGPVPAAAQASQVVGGHRGAQVEGARQRHRLPPPHLRCPSYPVDPKDALRPADALRRRLPRIPEAHRDEAATSSSSRRPTASTTGCTLDALVAFGPMARAVVVVNDTVSDADSSACTALGARGIRFNLAQAGATTAEMIEPLAKRVNDLGWHVQLHSPAPDHGEHADSEGDPSPIVFDHIGRSPSRTGEPPLFRVPPLIDKGRTWVSSRGPKQTPRWARRRTRTRPRSRAPS